jgi:RHS repeat-associated protein
MPSVTFLLRGGTTEGTEARGSVPSGHFSASVVPTGKELPCGRGMWYTYPQRPPFDRLRAGLGSTSVLSDGSGQRAGERVAYLPYGRVRLGDASTLPTDYTFTGQRDEAGLGLMHYGARFYSPRLGRFVSADSILPDYDDPQALNRYAYVLNNPLLYTDPSGHCPLSISQCWTVIDGHQVPIDRDFPGGYYHIPVTPSHAENWGVDLPYDPIWDRPMGVEAAVAMGDTPEQYYQGMATMFSLLLSAMGWASAWSAAERAAWAANEAEALSMLDDAAQASDLPTLEIDSQRMPKIADGIKEAQGKGAPDVLTRTTDPGQTGQNRYAATKGFNGVGSPDEYPFASTMEGGADAFVTDVPLREQHVQGGVVSRFYQQRGIEHGDKFRVRVK